MLRPHVNAHSGLATNGMDREARLRQAVFWWMSRSAARCFLQWHAVVAEARRVKGLLRRAVGRMSQRGLSSAWNAWLVEHPPPPPPPLVLNGHAASLTPY